MAHGPLADVLRYLRRFAPGDAAAVTDRALLERFISERDQAGFEALLARHGPMVWGVCRGLLYDEHTAEDAFQATFLILVRKAASIGRRELLASWLYGVAQRVARRARASAARRYEREQQAIELAAPGADNPASRELVRVIHEELDRLPAKYRSPVVLCCLEGKTYDEAATELGWSRGAVRGRLERARGRLRDRLVRRGVTLSAALLADPLAEYALAAAVPRPLLAATAKAALLLAAEGTAALGLLPVSVTVLVEGVLHAMFLTKVKIAGAFVLAVAVLTTGSGMVIRLQQVGAQQPAKEKVEQAKPDAAKLHEERFKAFLEGRLGQEPPPVADLSDDKVKALLAGLRAGEKMNSLLKEQFEAARTETDARWKGFSAGRETLDIYLGASVRLLQAELDLSNKREDQIAALTAHWQRAKDLETVQRLKFQAGRVPIQDYMQSLHARARAEIWLERAKVGQAVKLDKDPDAFPAGR